MNYISKDKRNLIVTLLLIFVVLIIYIAIDGYGKIGSLKTTNVDIFNIENIHKNDKIKDLKNPNLNNIENINNINRNIIQNKKEKNKKYIIENKVNKNNITSKNKIINKDKEINIIESKYENKLKNIIENRYENKSTNIIENKIIKNEDFNKPGMLKIHDEDMNWNSNKELKIFSNPVYNMKNIITPGSHNIYKYVITNNENFAIMYKLKFIETNSDLINMKFKLKKNGEYIIGDFLNWGDISEKIINGSFLEANSYDVYLLEWKWFDGENDVKAGFNQSNYKLNIDIKAKSL